MQSLLWEKFLSKKVFGRGALIISIDPMQIYDERPNPGVGSGL